MIHRRASYGPGSLAALAQELRTTLSRCAVQPPYILAGHSFGALVVRQYAAMYPEEVKGLLFVDGLLPNAVIPRARVRQALWSVRLLQVAASIRCATPLLHYTKRHIQAMEWAFIELAKYPEPQRREILAEWNTPEFYRGAQRILRALPANLCQAAHLRLPEHIRTISLHSDYPDPTGLRIDNAGHWIQIDQPEAVANAIRELAATT